MNNNQSLIDLPNIGKTLAEKLIFAGIESSEQLFSIGSESAFVKLATIDQNTCINQLYALEGAIQGIRWHDLSLKRKQELLEFFKIVNK
ncbi:MAG: TfoX/Sxy family protein [Bacteroidales bacterium]|nr:TfoX/Sxy family protein [Bacteroidales bacterium]MDD3860284.1 TfoX/Sxy family protein [Bacteroidales bacterium]